MLVNREEVFKKPAIKFITQMVYGIQVSKDVKLSNVSRVLNEKIAFIKTENCLSRNAKNCDLTEDINRSLLKEGASSTFPSITV